TGPDEGYSLLPSFRLAASEAAVPGVLGTDLEAADGREGDRSEGSGESLSLSARGSSGVPAWTLHRVIIVARLIGLQDDLFEPDLGPDLPESSKVVSKGGLSDRLSGQHASCHTVAGNRLSWPLMNRIDHIPIDLFKFAAGMLPGA